MEDWETGFDGTELAGDGETWEIEEETGCAATGIEVGMGMVGV